MKNKLPGCFLAARFFVVEEKHAKAKNLRKRDLFCQHKCNAILQFWIHVQYVVQHTVKYIGQYIVEHLGLYICQIIPACHSQQHPEVEVSSPKRADKNIFSKEKNIPNFQDNVMGLENSSNVLPSLTANYSVSKNNILPMYHLQLWKVGKYQQTASCDHYQYVVASHLTFAQNKKNLSWHEIFLDHAELQNVTDMADISV